MYDVSPSLRYIAPPCAIFVLSPFAVFDLNVLSISLTLLLLTNTAPPLCAVFEVNVVFLTLSTDSSFAKIAPPKP